LRCERWLTLAAVLLTLGAFGGFLVVFSWSAEDRLRSPFNFVKAAGFLIIVGLLVYGGLVYLSARLGYMRRRSDFRHASSDELAQFVAATDVSVAILVPSFKEEPPIVRQTLLSAALQNYPNRRVVLLIDDPPDPPTAEDRDALAAVRGLPAEIQRLVDEAREPFFLALVEAEARARIGRMQREQETARLAQLYQSVAAWFEHQAKLESVDCHSDALFVEMCLSEPSTLYSDAADELQRRHQGGGPYPTCDELLAHYRQLDAIFAVEVTSFERKRYANLSHAPNKAMNLNSYIALMGRHVGFRRTEDGLELHDVPIESADLAVPDATYVLTLDADSLLEPEYAPRLVHFLEQPENARVAVAQTPYSAVPGAPGRTERIAGATTDLQYVIHQGFTAHGATYWVGANAVLRKRALDDISSTVRDERTGRSHIRYIQDRTVIEDTESTVDLIARGWKLFNYPARLSYSATPADFGALVVQRRRWANGGLLILPKLLRVLLRRPVREAGRLHGFMRVHYLVSITAVNAGLMVLFLVPFAAWYGNFWLPLAGLPYFALYAHDLRLAGYRRRDVVRVYALNLLLIPVNLGGVVKSLHQAVTGRGSMFKRTPKVKDRTSAPPSYILVPCALAVFLMMGSAWSFQRGSPWQGVASGLNGALLLYAVGAFVGWRHSWEDLAAQVRRAGLAVAQR
jgi:cellulose synthase/poly-beta-1,6-N-acetylglucosamine synthase-like glycosyltransferase